MYLNEGPSRCTCAAAYIHRTSNAYPCAFPQFSCAVASIRCSGLACSITAGANLRRPVGDPSGSRDGSEHPSSPIASIMDDYPMTHEAQFCQAFEALRSTIAIEGKARTVASRPGCPSASSRGFGPSRQGTLNWFRRHRLYARRGGDRFWDHSCTAAAARAGLDRFVTTYRVYGQRHHMGGDTEQPGHL